MEAADLRKITWGPWVFFCGFTEVWLTNKIVIDLTCTPGWLGMHIQWERIPSVAFMSTSSSPHTYLYLSICFGANTSVLLSQQISVAECSVANSSHHVTYSIFRPYSSYNRTCVPFTSLSPFVPDRSPRPPFISRFCVFHLKKKIFFLRCHM